MSKFIAVQDTYDWLCDIEDSVVREMWEDHVGLPFHGFINLYQVALVRIHLPKVVTMMYDPRHGRKGIASDWTEKSKIVINEMTIKCSDGVNCSIYSPKERDRVQKILMPEATYNMKKATLDWRENNKYGSEVTTDEEDMVLREVKTPYRYVTKQVATLEDK